MSTANGYAASVTPLIVQALEGDPAKPARALSLLSTDPIRFPSEFARTNLRGSTRTLDKVTGTDLEAAMGRVLANPSGILLVHAGNLMRADQVLTLPADFYSTLAPKLLERSMDIATTEWKGITNFLGKQSGSMKKLSLDERALRVGKGLMTMAAEMVAHGIDPTQLANPRWYDAALTFVRAYVMRAGYEHGARFEFRMMLELETTLTTTLRRFRYQRQMPLFDGKSVNHGVDAFLHQGGIAYPIQLKAFKDLASLFSGRLSYPVVKSKRVIQRIKDVEGPEMPRQMAADLIRLGFWELHVPGVDLDWKVAAKPLTWTGWDDLAPVSVGVVDDSYLLNHLMAQISLAIQNGGSFTAGSRQLLYVASIHVSARSDVQTLLAPGIKVVSGDAVLDVTDADWLWETALARLRAELQDLQDQLTAYFTAPDVVAWHGRPQEIRLLQASDGVDNILELLELDP